jgi:hypothetical protein
MNALKRYTRTLLCSVGLIVTTLVAGCGGGGDQGRDPILGMDAATLVSINVTPSAPTLSPGRSQQFSATATYSDASTRDVTATSVWSSATTSVATINASSGLAATVSAGTTAIGASFGGKSGATTLTVANPTVLTLVVSPQAPSMAVGTSRQMSAFATYSDGTSGDVTASTLFSSATPGVATSTTGGLVSAKAAGTTLVTGGFGGKSASTTLTVTAPTVLTFSVSPQSPTLQVGASRQLAAFATFSDGTSGDVSSSTVFSSASPLVANTTPSGLVAGVSSGSAVITGAFLGKTDTTTVTVSGAVLNSITVTPASATVGVNGTQQFIATAAYSDLSTAIITNNVLWSSSVSTVANVSATGLATGVSIGSTNITAALNGKSGSAVLNVVAVPPVGVLNPVNLRTAASFGVLAGTSITNNSGGTTLVTGDVGSPSQTTDPTQAAGYFNYKSGKILSDALGDLQLAITDANGRACTVNFPGGIDLGGLVLTPGVYCATGAISITGTLNLSGNGVFIFRTASTLNSTANSIVALTSGASDANVYWLPVGPTTLGANSVFKGSILGQAAAITLGDNANLQNGRVLTAAAVTLANNKITK